MMTGQIAARLAVGRALFGLVQLGQFFGQRKDQLFAHSETGRRNEISCSK